MSNVTCRMLHVTCHMSNAYVDFHVYAQMSLFVGENDNAYLLTAPTAPPLPVSEPIIELVPS